jgi:putative DNA primase/helicase
VPESAAARAEPFVARVAPALAKGWAVHAVKPLSKNPLFVAGLQEHAGKDATKAMGQILALASEAPDANYGIPSWPQNHLLVVDVDPKNGGDTRFLELGRQLPGDCWDTFRVITPSGGMHFYFSVDRDLGITGGAQTLGGGIDVIYGGLWVVGPGSVRDVDGRRVAYEFAKGVGWDTPVKPLPAELLSLFKAQKSNPVAAVLASAKIPAGARYDAVVKMAGQLTSLGWTEAAVMSAVYDQAVATFETKVDEPAITSASSKALIQKEASRVWRKYHDRSTRHAGDVAPNKAAAQTDVLVNASRTDTGAALRLHALHGENFRYVTGWGWMVWDGTRWRRDDRGRMVEWMKDTAKRTLEVAARLSVDKQRQELQKFGERYLGIVAIRHAIDAAASMEDVIMEPDAFDAKPDLLNAPNCTIHLPTGNPQEHRREDYLTHCIPIEYHADAEAKLWSWFVGELARKRPRLVNYLQRCGGYTLTGHTREEILLFLWGNGQNGKTTFIDVLGHIVGDLVGDVDAEALNGGPRARPELVFAKMEGRRMGTCQELSEGRPLDEGFIKKIIGGTRAHARDLYEKVRGSRDVSVTFKLWLDANYRPTIKGNDKGIWRRIKMVPCQTDVPDDKRINDLKEKLKGEAKGILAWLVRGAVAYNLPNPKSMVEQADPTAGGLQEPPEVTAATKQYRDENDLLGRFIGECMTVDETKTGTCSAKCPCMRIGANDLRIAYNHWAATNGEKEISAKMLASRMQQQRAGFFGESVKTGAGGTMEWHGLAHKVEVVTPQARLDQVDGGGKLDIDKVGPVDHAQHDRMRIVLDVVGFLEGQSPRGYALEADILVEAERRKIAWQDTKKALETMKRNNAVYAKGGIGTFATLRGS